MSTRAKRSRKSEPLVYLVDDEPMLLDLAELALRPDGYAFKKFTDPIAALNSFLDEEPKPALMISDYTMGKMNGLELMRRCREASPGLKTILVTGTTGVEIVFDSPTRVDRFLGKPYQPANLAELVRRVLAAK